MLESLSGEGKPHLLLWAVFFSFLYIYFYSFDNTILDSVGRFARMRWTDEFVDMPTCNYYGARARSQAPGRGHKNPGRW